MLMPATPIFPPTAGAELFVAAVVSWVCFHIYGAVRDPMTPPADGVLLDLALGLGVLTAVVFWSSASLKMFF